MVEFPFVGPAIRLVEGDAGSRKTLSQFLALLTLISRHPTM
jgi:RecG-like helicase